MNTTWLLLSLAYLLVSLLLGYGAVRIASQPAKRRPREDRR